MKIVVVGATGTIGSKVVEALLVRHDVIGVTSCRAEMRGDLDVPTTTRELFERVHDVDAVVSCAGNAVFKSFAELTDADYEMGLRKQAHGASRACPYSQGSPARWRLDYSDFGYAVDGAGARKRLNFDSECRTEGFVRATALELPRKLRINVVSPPWVKETMIKLGMDPTSGLAAVDVAKAYVAAVESLHQALSSASVLRVGAWSRAKAHVIVMIDLIR